MITAYFIKAIPILLVLILLKIAIKRITIFEYENGLKYSKGQFKGILNAGQTGMFHFFQRFRK